MDRFRFNEHYLKSSNISFLLYKYRRLLSKPPYRQTNDLICQSSYLVHYAPTRSVRWATKWGKTRKWNRGGVPTTAGSTMPEKQIGRHRNKSVDCKTLNWIDSITVFLWLRAARSGNHFRRHKPEELSALSGAVIWWRWFGPSSDGVVLPLTKLLMLFDYRRSSWQNFAIEMCNS